MTTRETLTAQGFCFFMFTKPEDRAAFKQRTEDTFEFAEFTEVFCHHDFKVLFLGVRRLHHTPVKYTPAREAL